MSKTVVCTDCQSTLKLSEVYIEKETEFGDCCIKCIPIIVDRYTVRCSKCHTNFDLNLKQQKLKKEDVEPHVKFGFSTAIF